MKLQGKEPGMKLVSRHKLLCLLFAVCGLFPTARAGAQAYLYADVFSLSTNAQAATNVDLGTVSLRRGLYMFPYYIRINYPPDNLTAWGIQLYTDNNPTGFWVAPDGVYGGLRGRTNQTYHIPLRWQVYEALQDAAPSWGTPQSITMTAGGLAFYPETLRYWGLVPDRSDEDQVRNWMGAENLQRRAVVNYLGLGPFPRTGRAQTQPPMYLYLGMDLGPVSQMTLDQQFGATLRLDMYNLGVDLSQGGYATPNPFTPATGQRVSFNFTLVNMDSPVKIYIYTVRGRRIRTLSSGREWDGRNDAGQLVEGGLYIYQIEAEGKRVSGTVVVIK
jgi:hypothetical protein